jgi:propionyl-CoA carboxylase beta chain
MDPKLIEDLKSRRKEVAAGGGEAKNNERRAKGLMTARDRIDVLLDPGSFQEAGMHARHRCRDFDMDKKEIPADGVVTGLGTIDGRGVGIASQDFTVAGGSLGRRHADKICETMQQCLKLGIPFVGVNDSGGARIQEGAESLSGYGDVFHLNVQASGVVPQIAVITGPCAGGAAYSPALCDFVIMTRSGSFMFICGPDVIKAACYQDVTKDDIGSPDVHMAVSGNAHFVVNSDAEAMDLVRRLLSFLPQNNMVDPPHDLSQPVPCEVDAELEKIMPANNNAGYDVKQIIARVADGGDFLEVQDRYAPNLVVGFARIGGVVSGIVANNPAVKAGTLDIDASDKGARFILFCNSFNIPVVTFVDTPGFLPGIQQERGGIIRHGAKMLYAYSATTTPKVTVILRKSYGGAYIAMASKHLGADAVYAWPTAEIAVMGADQAVNVIYRNEIKSAENPKERQAELGKMYRDRFSSPFQAASLGYVDDVIDPSETRMIVAKALRQNLTKRVNVPGKKNGNMPV